MLEYRVRNFGRRRKKPSVVSIHSFEETVRCEACLCADYNAMLGFFLSAEQSLFCAYALHNIDESTYIRCKAVLDCVMCDCSVGKIVHCALGE